jgi:2-polyprenyl-3-methyl-5-hydroxy-6-metoxy-1,4-benzoquinol methylase
MAATETQPAHANELDRELPEGVWFDDTPTASYLRETVHSIVASFGRQHGTPLRIVDFGCGNGSIAAELAVRKHQVIGIDRSSSGIQLARKRGSTARFEVCSLYQDRLFDIAGEGADCVLAIEVIEHTANPRRVFEAARRVLRPGGLIIVTTPYHGYLKNIAISLVDGWDRHFQVASVGGHIKFFSRRTLDAMAKEHGFHDRKFQGTGRLPGLRKSLVMSARTS